MYPWRDQLIIFILLFFVVVNVISFSGSSLLMLNIVDSNLHEFSLSMISSIDNKDNCNKNIVGKSSIILELNMFQPSGGWGTQPMLN